MVNTPMSIWVTDSRMLCSLPRSCLVHPVDCFDSEGWFNSDLVIFLTVFRVFWWKKHATFKWKDTILWFPVSPGSAEALVRWGGKIKYVLIACFLGNICAKNCRNRTAYVKITASCKGGTFFETQCKLIWAAGASFYAARWVVSHHGQKSVRRSKNLARFLTCWLTFARADWFWLIER